MVDYGEGDVGICLILIQDDTGPEAVNCEGFTMKLIKNENIQARMAGFVVWSRNLFQIPFTIKAVDVGYLISGNCAFNLIAKVCSSIIGCAGAQATMSASPRHLPGDCRPMGARHGDTAANHRPARDTHFSGSHSSGGKCLVADRQ